MNKQDAMSRIVIAIVSVLWALVLIGAAFWLSKSGSTGVGAAVACLAYSAGYFWFAWRTYHEDGAYPLRE
jgi:O-antigen/teichoic acid export membrane protein